MSSWWCEHAWLPGADAPAAAVRVLADPGGRITHVIPGAQPDPEDVRLAGLVLPGFANAHSHAFHRALRGRTHDAASSDSFWTWRVVMY